MQRSKRTVGIGLGAAVVLAVAAWIVGSQIRSPAQIAAETAAPNPSAITVPVERRVLSSEVIVRGTVRYGSPQPVVLASSEVKQASGTGGGGAPGGDIVTQRPRRGARFSEGTQVMSVSGRPVFVLRGAQPSHRDMHPGSRGPDVRQLEASLARMGFPPGPIDGRYDGRTAAAVADWYEKSGWAPFGSTDTQLDQLRTASANAAQARDAYLQSLVAIQQAGAGGLLPGELARETAQARIDLQTARDTADTALHDLRSARIKLRQAREAARLKGGPALAVLEEQRDNATAAADLAAKRAAFNKAIDAQAEAQRNLAEAPPDTSASERAALQAAVRQAGDDVSVAQADVNAAIAAANATRAAGRQAVARARVDRSQALRDAQTAATELARARRALPAARRQVTLATQRLSVLQTPHDTTLQQRVAESARREAHGTEAEVSRLARKMGIQVPADEVLFFNTLPLRVDSVRVRRGDTVSGRVMTVSNSRLAIDSSLSVNDAKLVRKGNSVKIEEPDLGVRSTGQVSLVADRPGTHKVDPSRIYLEVTPGTAPAQLVGASVKLTIAVRSTEKAVLAVPLTALSVGADGSSRVQVQRPGGRAEYVTVTPGLAAKGMVEIRATDGRLAAGDLVIVGTKGTVKGGTSTPSGGGQAGGGATSPSAGTTPESSGTSGKGSTGATSGKGSTGATGGNGSTGTTTGPSGGEAPKGTTPGGGQEGSTGGGTTGPSP